MEYRGPSSTNSTRPQGRRVSFNGMMMHHQPPPFSGFQNSMSRPASPPVPTFNFNGNIVEGIRNPTLRYRSRVPGLSDRQQQHIFSLEHNLQVISRDHESLLGKFTKMNQELQSLRMQQKASDTLKRELKIGLEIDQHKGKEVIEPIEQEANEPIEEIKIELLEEDVEMEQHQSNDQHQSIFDPKLGMDIITKMYPPCLCDSTKNCICKPEVSVAVVRIDMRDFKSWHFSYEHQKKHNEVEVTPALLLEFGYLDKIFINRISQLESFPEKLIKVAEDYLERWKEICISFISSHPDWYVHMHKEKARHIAMINEESFRLNPISSHRWTPSYKDILKFRGIQMFALDEFEDFRYDMVLVAEEEEMYIYSKTRISHQPYWKPQNFKEETAGIYYKVKEDRERDAELVEGDEQYWNNLSEEELHNIDNMMEA
ncbi:hypothetical protein EV1_033136 [Malus domestica]